MRENVRSSLPRLRRGGRLREQTDAERESESNRELRDRIAGQWAEVRAARRAMEAEPQIVGGPSNFRRAQVPYAVDLAASWGWRFLVIAGSAYLLLYLVGHFMVVFLPLVIALFAAALARPIVGLLERLGLKRSVASMLVVVVGIAVVAALISFVGAQISNNVGPLSKQVSGGLGQIDTWLRHGPLHASDSQINGVLTEAQAKLSAQARDLPAKLSELTAALGHVVAGFFIVLFATYFFLADGAVIWAWIVRLFPRAARTRADSSGRIAWTSLTQFVRATVLVAATDAAGIMIGAAILGVPLVGSIGVLVFLGAFIPLVGALVSGSVAVLVALVAQGPLTALIMLGVVVLVMQVEAHVLQPFLMGRFVSVHPLGVIVAIALGVIVAGIPGALIAVPLVAAVNVVAQHLATGTEVGESPLPHDGDDGTEEDGAVGDTDVVPDSV